jgi:hypothetical protein
MTTLTDSSPKQIRAACEAAAQAVPAWLIDARGQA